MCGMLGSREGACVWEVLEGDSKHDNTLVVGG